MLSSLWISPQGSNPIYTTLPFIKFHVQTFQLDLLLPNLPNRQLVTLFEMENASNALADGILKVKLLSNLCIIIILSLKLFICPEITQKWGTISIWHLRVPTVAVTSEVCAPEHFLAQWLSGLRVMLGGGGCYIHSMWILFDDDSIRLSVHLSPHCTKKTKKNCLSSFTHLSSLKSLCFHGYRRPSEAGRSWIYAASLSLLFGSARPKKKKKKKIP